MAAHKRIVVTGASGFAARATIEALCRYEYPVCRLQRRPSDTDQDSCIAWELTQQFPEGASYEAEWLIHFAWDLGELNEERYWKTNVEGSIKLLEEARAAGIRKLIFISSMTAFEGTESRYGRAKLEVEKAAARLGSVIVRPGLIYDTAHKRGMLSLFERLADSFPIIPLPGTGQSIQYLCHEDDLAKLLIQILEGPSPSPDAAPISAAHSRPYQIRTIVSQIAQRKGKRRLLLPVPWRGIYFSLKPMEILGIIGRPVSDSLLGLVHYNPKPEFCKPFESIFRPWSSV